MNNGSETGLGAGGPPVQNPSDMRGLYTVSADNVPHIFSVGWVYQLPFGKGKWLGRNVSGPLDKFIGNWQISAIQFYQSGRPLSITTANDLGQYLFNYAKFPDKAGSGTTGTFKNPATDSYLNQSGWADPGFAFGNAPRMDENVRGFRYFNEDFSIYKDTYISEENRRYVRFQADGGNIFNRVFFCPVDQFWLPNNGNAYFGHTGSQCNIPRRFQLVQIFF